MRVEARINMAQSMEWTRVGGRLRLRKGSSMGSSCRIRRAEVQWVCRWSIGEVMESLQLRATIIAGRNRSHHRPPKKTTTVQKGLQTLRCSIAARQSPKSLAVSVKRCLWPKDQPCINRHHHRESGRRISIKMVRKKDSFLSTRSI